MKRLLLAITGMLVCACAGCNLFPHFHGAKEEKLDKEPIAIAGLPNKHAMRISQFVFLSDLELRRDAPLFKDLEKHREHVYRELRLPPSHTEIFVYLFD